MSYSRCWAEGRRKATGVLALAYVLWWGGMSDDWHLFKRRGRGGASGIRN